MTMRAATGRLASRTRPSAAAWPIARPAWRALTAEHLGLVIALALTAAIVAGMALNLSAVSLAASGAAILAGVISPATGLVTLAMMAPLKSPALPAPGFNALLVAAVLVGCLYRLPVERRRIRVGLPVVLLSAFVLYVGVQQLPEMLAGYGGPADRLIGYYFIQLLTGFGAILAAGYVLAGRSPRTVIAAGLTAAVVAALLAIATFNSETVRGPLVGLIAVPEDLNRAVGPFGNPNYFGQFQATAIVLAVATLPLVRGRWPRLVLVATLAPLGAALALSLSRGAALTLFAGLIVLAFARSRRLGLTLITATVLLVVVVYPLFVQWRLEQTNPNSVLAYSILERSDEGRLEAVLAGPQLFLSSPVFGIGWGQYQEASTAVLGYQNTAHNWYSKVMAEQGIVGIVLWIGLLASVVVQLRRRSGAARLTGLALFSAYATGSIFAEPPSSFQASALVLLIVTAAIVGDWRNDPGVGPAPDGSPGDDGGSGGPGGLPTAVGQGGRRGAGTVPGTSSERA